MLTLSHSSFPLSLCLRAWAQADTELQSMLEAAGGDSNFFVLEQLDLDGDGEITWMEFEQCLGDAR